MNALAQQLLQSVLALPEKDRAAIAGSLLNSLEEEDEGTPEEVEKAWELEIQRRMEEIDRGEVTMVPHEELMRRLNEQIQ